MNVFKNLLRFTAVIAAAQLFWTSSLQAAVADKATDVQAAPVALIGVQGYDLVSYHQPTGPVRGSGFHVAEHKGVSYMFANAENKATFQAKPEEYLPAYGGYCAFGVAVGQKFPVNPLRYKLVDGKLYLNLDGDIQAKWNEDVAGHIKKADANWKQIATKTPAQLAAK
ncbi:MAG: YHS domain-containing (seleno)protein [Opitutales bacterium]